MTNPLDFFETPPELCRAALKMYVSTNGFPPHTILDAGAGTGNWGQAARDLLGEHAIIAGVDNHFDDPGSHKSPYDYWINDDFLNPKATLDIQRYDLVMGNPPYSLTEEFVRQGITIAQNGGDIMYLVRLGFLASQRRNFGLYLEHPPRFVIPLGERPSFTKNGVSDVKTDYALIIWSGDPQVKPITSILFGFTWRNGQSRMKL